MLKKIILSLICAFALPLAVMADEAGDVKAFFNNFYNFVTIFLLRAALRFCFLGFSAIPALMPPPAF